ncbi:hypothetical protein Nham_3970 [Nitrobacter hamburgensis X14]|uniref:Uncharacterized protein n=1 Tax=Nitrobacter hamburgensis (strain DSM 10229 / NCIMB 13809 / X14) TaxID=323097 RepID=Q1QGK2_NITHX|nr:hypothetical protein [Nitrobacter hamburgensis]ABE64645.1 hypothetical protein Nham_3970 [Nitrobacter hamburgensis X14]
MPFRGISCGEEANWRQPKNRKYFSQHRSALAQEVLRIAVGEVARVATRRFGSLTEDASRRLAYLIAKMFGAMPNVVHHLLGVSAGLRNEGVAFARWMIPVNIFDRAAESDAQTVTALLHLHSAISLSVSVFEWQPGFEKCSSTTEISCPETSKLITSGIPSFTRMRRSDLARRVD